MHETDGKPGGFGVGPDDIISSFSNYGDVIDLIAPGCFVLSYDHNAQPWKICGTSMASPHVAAAAGLAILELGKPTDVEGVEQIRQFLINQGFNADGPNGYTGHKDTTHEPLVHVAFNTEDTEPPKSGIWKPRANDIVSDIQAVSFWAIDDSLVTTCFEVDGVVQECKPPGKNGIDTHFDWDTTSVPDGSHVLGGEVCDVVSNCTIVRTVTVTTDNGIPPPPIGCQPTDFECRLDDHEKRIGVLEALP